MIKYSFETPIKYLYELDDYQDYLFILAQHLDNKKYFEYCLNSKKYKILDNGAYELKKSIDVKKLIYLANKINADVIIIPDKLFDKKYSDKLEREFFNNLKYKNKFKLMKVVCGKNLKEYIESLHEVSNSKKYDIIGLSQSRVLISPNLSFCMNIISNKKDVHLLGLDNPLELVEASKWKNIKSVDTGRPINYSFKNKIFPNVNNYKKYLKIHGYDITTNKKLNIPLAIKNINNLKTYYEKYY